MLIHSEIVIFIPILLSLLGFIIFSVLKKRRKSVKNIYKLINDLEKKYIY